MTASDIEAGRVRIPIGATKRTLPLVRSDIGVVLRERKLRCRLNSRYGPPERSDVIGVAAATELVSRGEARGVSR